MPESIDAEIRDHHIREATSALLHALHYERFFGAPAVGRTESYNRQGAEDNDRTVRAFAVEAGRRAYYSGEPISRWADLYPGTLSIGRIRESMEAGWSEAKGLSETSEATCTT